MTARSERHLMFPIDPNARPEAALLRAQRRCAGVVASDGQRVVEETDRRIVNERAGQWLRLSFIVEPV